MLETLIALVVIAFIAVFVWKARKHPKGVRGQARDAFNTITGGGKDGGGTNAQQ